MLLVRLGDLLLADLGETAVCSVETHGLFAGGVAEVVGIRLA